MFGFITTHIEVVGVILLTLLVAFILLQQRRSPQSTAAWILFLVLLPYVAVPVFLGLGFRKQLSDGQFGDGGAVRDHLAGAQEHAPAI